MSRLSAVHVQLPTSLHALQTACPCWPFLSADEFLSTFFKLEGLALRSFVLRSPQRAALEKCRATAEAIIKARFEQQEQLVTLSNELLASGTPLPEKLAAALEKVSIRHAAATGAGKDTEIL